MTFLILAASGLVCSFGCGEQIPVVEKGDRSVAFYCLVDVSRSVKLSKEEWEEQLSPIEELIISGTEDGDKIVFIAFGTNSVLIDSCTKEGSGSVSALLDSAIRAIDTITTYPTEGESTFTARTIFDAPINNMFVLDYQFEKKSSGDRRKRVVCLVTDGDPDSYWKEHLDVDPLPRIDTITMNLPGAQDECCACSRLV